MTVRRLTIVAIVGLVAGALVPGGTVRAQGVPAPVASENIELITLLPGTTGAIGANFQDGVMYLTTTAGLRTFDITNPRAPVLLGTLDLPHFENEDVSMGGDILLISNDASESSGILHVIDISDPETPALLTSFPMGGNPALGGPGHTASCVLDCKYAWVTDGAGIRVVDLTEPSAPVMGEMIETPAGGEIAAHDVQIDGNGLAWVVGFGGAVAYEIPDDYDGTDLGVEVARTNEEGFSTYGDLFGTGDGNEFNDYILHNSRRLKNRKVVYVTEEDYTRPGCEGAGQFETWTLPTEKVKENGRVSYVPTGEDLTPLIPGSWSRSPTSSTGRTTTAKTFLPGGALLHGLLRRQAERDRPGMVRAGAAAPRRFRPREHPSDRTSSNPPRWSGPHTSHRPILRGASSTTSTTSSAFRCSGRSSGEGQDGVIPCKGPSKKKCEKNHKPAKQTAPVQEEEWIGSYPLELPMPIGGTPEDWGYACRIIGLPGPDLPLGVRP